MKKLIPIIVALVASACLPSAADAAVRSLNLTKNVAKAGLVVDADGQVECGLDCTEDSGAYEMECDGEGFCIPPITLLTASPQPGWALQQWGGCTSTSENTCHVTMNTEKPKEIIATFADVQDPTAAFVGPQQGARLRGVIGWGATAGDNDEVSRVDFFVDGAKVGSDASAPYAVSFDTQGSGDGQRTLQARSFDASGRASAMAERTVVFDNGRPVVQITGGTEQDAILGPPAAATFEFLAGDGASPISAVECRLGTAEFAACQSTTAHSFAGLLEGEHTFSVRTTDAAGNVSEVASRTFRVDLTAPETVIESGRADGSSSTETDAAFTFSSEQGASFACRLYAFGSDAPAFGDCSGSGSHAVSGLAVGTYVFEVRAVDAVGNADASPATRTFAVAAPPETPNGEKPGGGGGGGTGGTTDPPAQPAAPVTPAPGPDATPQVPRIDADATWEWNNLRGRTRANSLIVKAIPAGATVEVVCDGRGCPFKRKAFAYKKPKLKLAAALKRRRMAAGTTLEVRVVKPGATGWVVAFRMRRKGQPSFKVLCLPDGATKAVAC